MSLSISIRTELIKAKRSSAFWFCLIGSGFIPGLHFLIYNIKPEVFVPRFKEHPWEMHFMQCWQEFSVFLLPVFVILVCSMIMQIEFKNNTWKQVFASPLSLGNVFLSKLITILFMILFLFVMFNIFVVAGGILVNLINKNYTFLKHGPEWIQILKMNFKTFIALLGIISFQYWLSMRFKNFIVPIGIGLALLITSLIVLPWEHIYKMPYAFPMITLQSLGGSGAKVRLLLNHELNSIGYFVFFATLAFFDLKYRKERG